MDDLFGQAAGAFVSGDSDLAQRAYGRLLKAIWGGEESEHLSGAEDPTELLSTDLHEAKSRYLRALYESTAPKARVKALRDAYSEFWWSGGHVGLGDIQKARAEDLPGLAEFLPAWIKVLKSGTQGISESEAKRLLSEAVLTDEGVDGLARLARESAATAPEFYLDLVRQLEATDRNAAIAAAVEALSDGVPRGEVRAQIADRLAVLSADVSAQVTARREAWNAGPSADRLAAMANAALRSRDPEAVFGNEADLLTQAGHARRDGPSARLTATLLLLANRYDRAVDCARRAGRDWASADHPGYVVVPTLLAAASVGSTLPRLDGSVLDDCLADIDRSSWHDRMWQADVDAENGPTRAETGGRESNPSLANLIKRRLPQAVGRSDRNRWMQAATDLVMAAVGTVLGATHRRAYDRIARLTVAAGEAMTAFEDLHGDRFVAKVLAMYPRHTAFRRELENAWRRSPAIGQSAPSRRVR